MLHQKAGSTNVYEVHGSPILHHCRRCGDEKTFDEILELRKRSEVPPLPMLCSAFLALFLLPRNYDFLGTHPPKLPIRYALRDELVIE